MTEREYIDGKRVLVDFRNNSRQIRPEEYIEALIVVKSHAWCMDVKIERRKMVRLILKIFEELSR